MGAAPRWTVRLSNDGFGGTHPQCQRRHAALFRDLTPHQGTGAASGWPFSANIQLRTFADSDELAFVAL